MMLKLVIALVFSQLDYSNAVLAGRYTFTVTASPAHRRPFGQRTAPARPRYADAQGAALAANNSTFRLQTVPARPQGRSRTGTDLLDGPVDRSR
jgi:hypothetical protein